MDQRAAAGGKNLPPTAKLQRSNLEPLTANGTDLPRLKGPPTIWKAGSVVSAEFALYVNHAGGCESCPCSCACSCSCFHPPSHGILSCVRRFVPPVQAGRERRDHGGGLPAAAAGLRHQHHRDPIPRWLASPLSDPSDDHRRRDLARQFAVAQEPHPDVQLRFGGRVLQAVVARGGGGGRPGDADALYVVPPLSLSLSSSDSHGSCAWLCTDNKTYLQPGQNVEETCGSDGLQFATSWEDGYGGYAQGKNVAALSGGVGSTFSMVDQLRLPEGISGDYILSWRCESRHN